MGYRSNVEIFVEAKDNDRVEKVRNVIKENEFVFRETKRKNGEVIVFIIDWVKWYSGYDDVEAVDDVVSELEVAMTIIGEDGATEEHWYDEFCERTGYSLTTYVVTDID